MPLPQRRLPDVNRAFHKGEPCWIEQGVLCQEGLCFRCSTWREAKFCLDCWEERKQRIELVPVPEEVEGRFVCPLCGSQYFLGKKQSWTWTRRLPEDMELDLEYKDLVEVKPPSPRHGERGRVVDRPSSRCLLYVVRFQDGSEGYYERSELERIPLNEAATDWEKGIGFEDSFGRESSSLEEFDRRFLRIRNHRKEYCWIKTDTLCEKGFCQRCPILKEAKRGMKGGKYAHHPNPSQDKLFGRRDRFRGFLSKGRRGSPLNGNKSLRLYMGKGAL